MVCSKPTEINLNVCAFTETWKETFIKWWSRILVRQNSNLYTLLKIKENTFWDFVFLNNVWKHLHIRTLKKLSMYKLKLIILSYCFVSNFVAWYIARRLKYVHFDPINLNNTTLDVRIDVTSHNIVSLVKCAFSLSEIGV